MATTKEKAPKTGGTPKAGKDKAAPGATDAAPKAAEGTPRLQTYYETVVRARLAKQFGITNPMQRCCARSATRFGAGRSARYAGLAYNPSACSPSFRATSV